MDFFDFIKTEELDDLPEDPHAAFIAFVRLAEPRLSARLREIGSRDQDTYEQTCHSSDPQRGSDEWCRLRDSNTRPRHYE